MHAWFHTAAFHAKLGNSLRHVIQSTSLKQVSGEAQVVLLHKSMRFEVAVTYICTHPHVIELKLDVGWCLWWFSHHRIHEWIVSDKSTTFRNVDSNLEWEDL